MSSTLTSPLLWAAESQDTPVNNPILNISIFLAFVVVTLVIVFRASRNNRSAADYYAAGRSFSGPQNGFAIAGDYLSAASFLGIVGAIAVNGYDGFLYSVGFLVAWLVALLLVAELMRNTAKFTMADVLAFRLKQRPVRMAAALTTLAVCFFYLLAQMAGAGGLVSLLLGVDSRVGQSLVIAIVGNVDFAIFPLSNPGIVSIPLGFLLGWIGSLTDRNEESKKLAAEMEVRSLTGHGAEKAVEH